MTLLMSCHEKYLIKSISDTVMAVGDGQVKQVDDNYRALQQRIHPVFENRKCFSAGTIPGMYSAHGRRLQGKDSGK